MRQCSDEHFEGSLSQTPGFWALVSSSGSCIHIVWICLSWFSVLWSFSCATTWNPLVAWWRGSSYMFESFATIASAAWYPCHPFFVHGLWFSLSKAAIWIYLLFVTLHCPESEMALKGSQVFNYRFIYLRSLLPSFFPSLLCLSQIFVFYLFPSHPPFSSSVTFVHVPLTECLYYL